MNKSDLIDTRNATVGDTSFIFATWLRSLYYGNSWYSEMDKDSFMRNYHRMIEMILAHPKVSVKVSCLKSDPEVILGYAIYREKIIDFTFVKKAWRGIGIAKSLIPSNITTSTHATKLGLSIIRKKNWKYDPFDVE
jgi:hypothetical protein